MLKKTDILGVNLTTENEDKILEFVSESLDPSSKKAGKIVIFTPNPEQVSASINNPDLRDMLNQADISLPDGVGILWAAKLLGKPIHARITGVDFMQKLVANVSKQPVITGYFGGQKGVAEDASVCLQKMYPKLRVGYAQDTYDKEKMIESN